MRDGGRCEEGEPHGVPCVVKVGCWLNGWGRFATEGPSRQARSRRLMLALVVMYRPPILARITPLWW